MRESSRRGVLGLLALGGATFGLGSQYRPGGNSDRDQPSTDTPGGDATDSVTWGSAADWDRSPTRTGIAHETVPRTDHTDAGTLVQGYQYADSVGAEGRVAHYPLHRPPSGGTESWEKDPVNPVTPTGYHDPCAFYERGRFYLFAHRASGTDRGIALFTSPDGRSFTDRGVVLGVEDVDSATAFVTDPDVIRAPDGAGATYWLVYQVDNEEIRYATSDDLRDWSDGRELFSLGDIGATGELSEPVWVHDPESATPGERFKMLFTADWGSGKATGYAHSPTGVSDWRVHDGNPVLATNPETGNGIEDPELRVQDGWYIQYVTDLGNRKQYRFLSRDLTGWFLDPRSPVLEPSASGWDSANTYAPGITSDGSVEHLYYQAAAGDGRFRIGHATGSVSGSHLVTELVAENHGTAVNAPKEAASPLGTGSYQFSASDGTYVDCGLGLFASRDRGTAMGWVYLDSFGDHYLLYEAGEGASNFAVRLPGAPDEPLTWEVGDTTALESTKSWWKTGQWYQLAVTWDGSTVTGYIDGSEDATYRHSATPGYATQNTQIGRFYTGSSHGGYHDGRIWNLRIDGVVRSDAAIADYYDTVRTPGRLATAWQSMATAASQLVTDSTVPPGTGIDVTVEQTTSGDETETHTRTVALTGGINEVNPLEGFVDTAGRYRVVISLAQTPGASMAALDRVTLVG